MHLQVCRTAACVEALFYECVVCVGEPVTGNSVVFIKVFVLT